jgi:hypothetical protein
LASFTTKDFGASINEGGRNAPQDQSTTVLFSGKKSPVTELKLGCNACDKMITLKKIV